MSTPAPGLKSDKCPALDCDRLDPPAFLAIKCTGPAPGLAHYIMANTVYDNFWDIIHFEREKCRLVSIFNYLGCFLLNFKEFLDF